MNLKPLAYEPSTYRGVVWLLTACGVAPSPDQQTAIIAFGMAAAGLIGAFFRDPPQNLTAQGSHETTGPNRDPPVSAQSVQPLHGNSYCHPLIKPPALTTALTTAEIGLTCQQTF